MVTPAPEPCSIRATNSQPTLCAKTRIAEPIATNPRVDRTNRLRSTRSERSYEDQTRERRYHTQYDYYRPHAGREPVAVLVGGVKQRGDGSPL